MPNKSIWAFHKPPLRYFQIPLEFAQIFRSSRFWILCKYAQFCCFLSVKVCSINLGIRQSCTVSSCIFLDAYLLKYFFGPVYSAKATFIPCRYSAMRISEGVWNKSKEIFLQQLAVAFLRDATWKKYESVLLDLRLTRNKYFILSSLTIWEYAEGPWN
jgi:hypothetical protein